MALKTGIVGMPNVGKASPDMLQYAHVGLPIYRGNMLSLQVMIFQGLLMQHADNNVIVLAVDLVQRHLQKRKSASSKFPVLHH